MACPVLDEITGKYPNYRQFMKHPTLSKILNPSAANELGRLFQGVGVGPEGQVQRIKGTDTFFVTLSGDGLHRL